VTGLVWDAGRLVPAAAVAWPETAAFETLGLWRGALPLWPRHVARLTATLGELGCAWQPPADLERIAVELAMRNGHDVVRLTVALAGGRALLTTRGRDAGREPLALLEVAAPPHDRTRAHKREPRTGLDGLRARARAAGAHDAVLVSGGLVLECTSYNLFAAVGDELVTPPADGRLLPGIARGALLEALAAAGTPAVLRPLPVSELRASPALFVTNAVYGPRRAALSPADAVGDANPWAGRLAAAWRLVVGGPLTPQGPACR
jgi:branched-subunit amino acid aminotransferase/4-amino-4-deoxychorismate lyase